MKEVFICIEKDCKSNVCQKGRRCRSHAALLVNKLNPRTKTVHYCIRGCGHKVCKKNNTCHSCSAKERYTNPKNHPSWKGGQIIISCANCNKEKLVYPRDIKRSEFLFCDTKCRGKWQSNNITGKNHPNYIEGLNRKYPREFTEKLKHEIRLRDNYQCQNKNCNITEEEHVKKYKRVLHIHHIDHNKDNIRKKNLITTCCVCNNLANKEYEYWKKYYKQIIKEKYVS